MKEQKELQTLDDEALDQVSGGIQFTTLIHNKKKGQNGTPNDLVYRGGKVETSGLVFRSDVNGLTANNLIGQNAGTGDEDNTLISL